MWATRGKLSRMFSVPASTRPASTRACWNCSARHRSDTPAARVSPVMARMARKAWRLKTFSCSEASRAPKGPSPWVVCQSARIATTTEVLAAPKGPILSAPHTTKGKVA